MEIINFKPLLPDVNKPSINALLIPNPIGVSNNIGCIDANPLLQLRNVSETNKQAESNITQPFLMNDNQIKNSPIIRNGNGIRNIKDNESSPFIVANSQEISLDQLSNECIIPVFSKDNERTIAHQEFIEVVLEAVNKIFTHHSISVPEIRVSHQIKGRIPEAIHKNAKDLLDHEKTIYYERMAFIIKLPQIKDIINGNELSLTLGGVRSYNLDNLYSKKSLEKFKFFIGFQNKVCCNLCVSSDGFIADIKVSSMQELQSKIVEVILDYNVEKHLVEMKEFTQYYLSEHQFAQLIGRSRLYQYLPKLEKQNIPILNFNDSHINTMAKDYYEDKNFSRVEDGSINLWDVYNLFTQANKSSYIDTFLDRNLNAFEFTKGLQKTLNGESNYHWFLS
ncbi:DUF3871 family protein [Elizabethkingia anophelis]|uniref:DUF3871 family protein n=2 Tax=Weeksellaceae TaxID=2762318 RepID=UPI0021A45042|nr:DUF3871 family protein [Elizabethkingia anophelis]MCT3643129.1 DUF3871 family protein [Elizabethkingia anophelis]MCT3676175.1 DUF3871 family protein [Elizabethkingia anophelis]MCT3683610.1 DUF3871 family protein [Elizabethkingia anophelis]MCT3855173.1 DUF3871 family protein [Elizabethkingia anophelis]CAH1138237.1 hypothetical protein EAVNVH72_02799 [Elizabethkingia anophelis]